MSSAHADGILRMLRGEVPYSRPDDVCAKSDAPRNKTCNHDAKSDADEAQNSEMPRSRLLDVGLARMPEVGNNREYIGEIKTRMNVSCIFNGSTNVPNIRDLNEILYA